MSHSSTTNPRMKSPSHETAQGMTDVQKARKITMAIKAADRETRERFRFLRYQNALGVAILVTCLIACVTSGTLFLSGELPFWACILINTFFLAMVRELEHDLVHDLYFRENKKFQNLMMAVVWPLLGNLPHPWFRRQMHLLHHRTSGHEEDFEERLIGNGMKFGPLKILAMVEPGLAMFFRRKELEGIPFYDSKKVARACFPVVFFYHAMLLTFLLVNAVIYACHLLGVASPNWLIDTLLPIVNSIAVIYVLPNMLRQVSVQIISSWMHYYGDINNRLHETQVMNAWYLLPLNLFCVNFGSTHAIHHFYAKQPFYIRQMVARTAHRAFKQYGIRYNDAASVLRGNRFNR